MRSILKKLLSIKKIHQQVRTMASEHAPIFNFAFLDLETTGLPSEENNKTRVTELSIICVESNHIGLGVYPRVLNKLSLCLNPYKMISPITADMTGLSNDMLENQTPFTENVVKTINQFLNIQKKPICFVAHNGNKFDFPILRAELNKIGHMFSEDILCMDSLICFQDLHKKEESEKDIQENFIDNEIADNITYYIDEPDIAPKQPLKKSNSEYRQNIRPELLDGYDELLCAAVDSYEESLRKKKIQKALETTPQKRIRKTCLVQQETTRKFYTTAKRNWTSFKLCDVYQRLTHKEPENTHHAEGDVELLIHCAAVLGDNFVEWANTNAILFSSIPPMRPGIKIGC